jgi:hypothetical protein
MFGVRTSKLDEQMRFESRKFLVAEVVVVVISTALGLLASERFMMPMLPSIAGGPWGALFSLASAVFGGWLGWTLTIQNIRLREWEALSAHALRLGRCPACGYDLRSTPAGDEGFTTCPECGAAWKPDRIGASDTR